MPYFLIIIYFICCHCLFWSRYFCHFFNKRKLHHNSCSSSYFFVHVVVYNILKLWWSLYNWVVMMRWDLTRSKHGNAWWLVVIKDNEKKKEFMRNLYQHAKFTDLMCHFEFDLVSKKESIKILLYVLAATIVFEPHLLVHAGLWYAAYPYSKFRNLKNSWVSTIQKWVKHWRREISFNLKMRNARFLPMYTYEEHPKNGIYRKKQIASWYFH